MHAQPLAENLTLLSGPGGNVVVLNGPDGKIVVDTFLLPAWPKLKENLDGLGNAPLKTVIDTHWHVDHTDNNANLRAPGATVLAPTTPRPACQSHTTARLWACTFRHPLLMLCRSRPLAAAKNCTPTVKL